ncbi:carbon-monoxide dehydrogenase large subunit [Constrictibacter sp. MBR-5]|jgi:carbon-monoxide dehydrogenase large subunit|uniref:xanthine dehydrogenase family protein molybdopterin-binding subunit n=1 Tax=Constrictibacter sp. MBR-5 TaxID=3156467 RepID=UPI003396BF5F
MDGIEKFGIGQPVRRKEDVRFVTGRGRFTDDVNIDGQAYGYVVRSPHAHAVIRSIDTADAAAMPGVVAVLTGQDAAADGIPKLPCQVDVPGAGGAKMFNPGREILQTERVRFVGDPVAFVVAETYEQARDAAEMVMVDYEDLPGVAQADEADEEGAPLLYPEHGSNLAVHWQSHDGKAVEEAFAKAAKVVTLRFVNNRVVGNPMEPRVAIGDWDEAEGRHTLISPTQGAVKLQTGLAKIVFDVPKEKVHVISPDTGGGFGLRGKLFPETVMVTWAAKRLKRPVKWLSDRGETFVSDPHGRDHISVGEMAFDAEGHILGVRVNTHANVGAYLLDFGPRISTVAGARIAGTVYQVPAMQLSVRVMFTNTVPTDAYRGAGRPEMAYQMERLLDVGAHALGLDRIEIRRRNFIRPDQLPWKNPVGMVIHSGEFENTMDLALQRADWAGFEARRQEAKARGRLRGIGLGYYIEASGGQPTEQATVRMTPEGRAQLVVGTFSHGQGHETAFAQILSEKLGIPFDDIDFAQGDTDFVSFGNGTGGSRSSQMGGVATVRAANQVIEKAKRIAAHAIEAAEADIEFEAGAFAVAGTDLSISLREVAKLAADPSKLPEGMTPGLDETCLYERSTECNFPNGAHICEVEIDPETGKLHVDRYTCVDDCGTIINPMLIAGQVHGGVAQGLGQALLEHTAYEPGTAQFLAASFMDYGMPRADDFPDMDVAFNPVPDPANDLGVKGAGEGGSCGAPPAIVSAIADALGIEHIDMPVGPEKVWRVLEGQRRKMAAE